MTVVGFHASHEQIDPTVLLQAVQRAEQAGFTAAMCSDHFSPWSERQGHSGFAWAWLGAALQATVAAVRGGQRARPAVPPGDHRPGHRHPVDDVRGAVLGGAGHRERRPTSTSPASAGRARSMRNARLRECVAIIRALLAGEEVSHDGLVTVDRARMWTPAGDRAGADRAGRVGRDRRLGRVLGRRAGHHRPAARQAAADDRRLPLRPAAAGPLVLQVHLSYADTDEEARAIAYDQWRSNVFDAADLLGPGHRRGLRRGGDEGAPPEDVDGSVSDLRRSRQARRAPAGARSSSASTRSTCTTSGSSRTGSSTSSATHVLPQLDVTGEGLSAMRITETSDLWWKTAVIYCLDVETFMDWNDDGVGRLPGPGPADGLPRGARRHLPVADAVLSDPGPRRRLRHRRLLRRRPAAGHLGDLVEVIRTARDRGMRVIADLVVNHTSDRHPWFKAARSSRTRRTATSTSGPTSRRRTPRPSPDLPRPGDQRLDLRRARPGQYYLHRFYKHQPDLNVANPKVRDEIIKIIGFWLRARDCPDSGSTPCRSCWRPLGIADAARSLPDPHGYPAPPPRVPQPAERRRDPARRGQPRHTPNSSSSSAVSKATNCTMQFDFIGMQRMYLSLARQRRRARWSGAAGPPA